MCREDADAEFLSTVAAEVEKASPGALTFLTGGNVLTPGWHHKPVDKIFMLSGPKGEESPIPGESLPTHSLMQTIVKVVVQVPGQ